MNKPVIPKTVNIIIGSLNIFSFIALSNIVNVIIVFHLAFGYAKFFGIPKI